MELKMTEYKLPEKILFNYEELKTDLTEKAKEYETMVYSDDQIKEAKADRAKLNKLKKALNDERIRVEREYMEPFNGFKAQINEIIGIIDKPVSAIDRQVKEYEEKKKQDKLSDIKSYFNSIPDKGFDTLEFDRVFNPRWLNASVPMSAVKEEINTSISVIKSDMKTLGDLPEYAFEAQDHYKENLDLSSALREVRRLQDVAKKKKEMEEAQKNPVPDNFMNEPEEVKTFSLDHENAQENPQDENECEQVPERVPYKKPVIYDKAPQKQWVAFQALLSVDEAMELKQFFDSRNIEFKPA